MRVEFVWFATFGITYTQSVSPVGDNAHGLTPIGANFVRATVYLDNGLGESTGPILHSCELGTGHH